MSRLYLFQFLLRILGSFLGRHGFQFGLLHESRLLLVYGVFDGTWFQVPQLFGRQVMGRQRRQRTELLLVVSLQRFLNPGE